MQTKHRHPRTAPEDWAEPTTTRKGKPAHRAKRHANTERAWRTYARSTY